jgi:hypothetical protein
VSVLARGRAGAALLGVFLAFALAMTWPQTLAARPAALLFTACLCFLAVTSRD